MFTKLKKLLSGCHINSKDKNFKFIKDASYDYCVRRAMEVIIKSSQGEDVQDNLKFAIQLLNMARYKHLEEYPLTEATNGTTTS